jgi:hypothetical protein
MYQIEDNFMFRDINMIETLGKEQLKNKSSNEYQLFDYIVGLQYAISDNYVDFSSLHIGFFHHIFDKTKRILFKDMFTFDSTFLDEIEESFEWIKDEKTGNGIKFSQLCYSVNFDFISFPKNQITFWFNSGDENDFRTTVNREQFLLFCKEFGKKILDYLYETKLNI